MDVLTRLAVLLLALGSLLPGQGAGLITGQGLEPRVRVPVRRVGLPSEVRVDRLVPSAPVIVAMGTTTAAVPLAAVGHPGGVVGIDLPSAILTPPMPADTLGTLRIPFVAPPSFVGSTYYVQVAQGDPTAPAGGLALSDVEVVTLATTENRVVTSSGPQVSLQSLATRFADGSATEPVLPDMSNITFLDVTLGAVMDTMALDGTRPWRDVSVPGRPCIRFADGSSLYHYGRATGHGFFLIRQAGQRFVHLVEVPLMNGQSPFQPWIAASPFEPLVAVLTDDPLPGSGTSLFLFRVDGENHPGTASPVRRIAWTGTLAGFDASEESLTFLDGALLLTDESQVVRVSTAPGSLPTIVPLPASGGVLPIHVEDEFAWSADGSRAALIAGASRCVNDVYVVGATGLATNVTRSPGAHLNLGYQDLLDGGRLALSRDGSRLAFIREVFGSPEVFVQGITPPMPAVQITTNNIFVSTIDQEVTVHFYVSADTLTFSAGSAVDDHDTYRAVVQSSAAQVQNLTQTGTPTMPFGAGTLHNQEFAALASGGTVHVQQDTTTFDSRLLQLDPAAQPVTSVTGIVGAVCSAPAGGDALIGFRTSGPTQVHRLTSTGSTPLFSTSGIVRSIVPDQLSGDAALFLEQGGVHRLVLLPTGTAPVFGPTGTGPFRGACRFADGSWLVAATQTPGSSHFLRVDPLGGSASLSMSGGDSLIVN